MNEVFELKSLPRLKMFGLLPFGAGKRIEEQAFKIAEIEVYGYRLNGIRPRTRDSLLHSPAVAVIRANLSTL